MISLDEALALTLAAARPMAQESAPLAQAAGRILAADVLARSDSPLWDVTAMDGYAARSADLTAPGARLDVIGRSLPGQGFEGRVEPRTCVRIFTGAPVPEGADRIVIQENVDAADGVATVRVAGAGASHIRRRGSDFQAGDVLLRAGARLTPQAMIAAAAADRADIAVWRRPRVVVLGTGDELAEPGRAHERAGAIPESVTFGVAALAEIWGGEVIGRRRLPDDLETLGAAAAEALAAADVVAVTGGASVGERDFARVMFGADLEIIFSKVAIKPGKPVWLGRAAGRLIVGLPGNPTSALVTARLFLAPLLAGLCGGDARAALGWGTLPLASPLPPTGDRETLYRGRRIGADVEPLSDQDSGAQRALAAADILIRRRAGSPVATAGEPVETLVL